MTGVGLALPQLGPVVSGELLREFAERAERMGFAHLWVQDHFLYALSQAGEYGGSAASQPDVYRSVYAPTEVLAAVAAWTTRVELGTSILVGGNHWPAQLAGQLATISRISDGRLTTIGFGVGWSHEEHRAVGVDPTTRGRRLDDLVPALLACWGDDPVEHHGPFFDIGPAVVRPKPVRPFRLMSGMWSPRGLARTAELFDVWNPGSKPVGEVVEQLADINRQRPEGKPPLGVVYRVSMESTAGKRLSIDEIAGRAAECREARFDGMIVDVNFCRELQTEDDWLQRLDELAPILAAAAG